MKILCKIFKECYKHFDPNLNIRKYTICNCRSKCMCTQEINLMNFKIPKVKDKSYFFDYNYELNNLYYQKLKK